MWFLVIGLSLALTLGGVAAWVRMLEGERDLRAANLVPPHRGAATTLSGMAIGLGLGGLIVGGAALLPNRTHSNGRR